MIKKLATRFPEFAPGLVTILVVAIVLLASGPAATVHAQTATPVPTATPGPLPGPLAGYYGTESLPEYLTPYEIPEPSGDLSVDMWDYDNMVGLLRSVITVWVLARDKYLTQLFFIGALLILTLSWFIYMIKAREKNV